jgi:hypothetical protein
MSVKGGRDEQLDLVFEEAGVDPGAALRELLAAARRGRTGLSEEASRELLDRVVGATRARPSRNASPMRWVAGLAAALSLVAVLWPRERTATTVGVVVKEVFFESVHEGEVARLEMTLYRTNPQD